MKDTDVIDLQPPEPTGQGAASPASDLASEDGTARNPFTSLHIKRDDITGTGWFGHRTQSDIWQAVAQATGACFEKGGFFTRAKVTGKFCGRRWGLTDKSTRNDEDGHQPWLTLESEIQNARQFTCRISEDNLFVSLGKAIFGFQDLNVGHQAVDKRFIIRGDNPRAIQNLFAVPRIPELLMLQPRIALSIGSGCVQLESSCTEDAQLILRLFELMYEIVAPVDV